jgi:thiosulfate dehydrogenase [quinone] large subunit
VEPVPRFGVHPSADAPEPSLREQLERASVPARALLPARLFFGATFVYAGLDKLLDPAFFDAGNPASIFGQLAAFARFSPLSPLIKVIEPFAFPIGLLIALAEIAIGLGALTGLAFRLAAAGGAVLSFTFWLTASWATKPYYYGPDLPYAFGWVALALAGDAGLLVPRVVREIGASMAAELPWSVRDGGSGGGFRPPRYLDEEPSASRRLMLQAGALAAASIVVASFAVPLRVLRGARGDDNGSRTTAAASTTPGSGAVTPTNAPDASAPASGAPAPGSTAAPVKLTGLTVASVAQVDSRGAVRFTVPLDAPSSLPAGDPAVVVKLSGGGYACYDAICTHQGCRVGWDAQDGVLLCPCHGAAFDPNNHAAVLGGPTNQPLLELPIVVDHAAGTITLKA